MTSHSTTKSCRSCTSRSSRGLNVPVLLAALLVAGQRADGKPTLKFSPVSGTPSVVNLDTSTTGKTSGLVSTRLQASILILGKCSCRRQAGLLWRFLLYQMETIRQSRSASSAHICLQEIGTVDASGFQSICEALSGKPGSVDINLSLNGLSLPTTLQASGMRSQRSC